MNDVKITNETILATREHFADIHRRSILEVQTGKVFVNNLHRYEMKERKRIADTLAGKNDYTLTFAQRAYWLQTGIIVAILK